MKEVPIREFTRGIYAFLRPGEYVVTKNGRDHLVVTITEPKRIPKPPEMPVPKSVFEKIENIAPLYGCGCPIGETKQCPKHGRD